MRCHNLLKFLVGVALYGTVAPALGAIFDETFDDLGAQSRFSAPFFSTEVVGAGAEFDGVVEYALDYSTFGLEAAPSSDGTTIGLGIQINNFDDGNPQGEAIAVSPLINDLPENYRVAADVFIYYAGGSGSSEHALLGVNVDRTAAPFNFVPAGAGTVYHLPHNSGLDNFSVPDDYYRTSDGVVTGLYGNATNLGLATPDTLNIPFVGVDPIFDDPGYAGNRWFSVELLVSSGVASMVVEGVLIDSFDVSGQSAGEILIGGADVFDSVNTENWVIWDNLLIEELGSGDFNNDGAVDAADYTVWRDTLGDSVAPGTGADANGNGVIDQGDYSQWAAFYGTAAPGAGVSVPEPAGVTLVAVLLTLAPRWRR